MIRGKAQYLYIVILFLAVSCASKRPDYTLEDPPKWYAEELEQKFVDVDRFMKMGFSRLEAMEIQNASLKRSASQNISFEDALSIEISNFKKGQLGESGYSPVTDLRKSDFIIVFDMDETLMVQWYKSYSKGKGYSDLCSGITDKNFSGTLESTDCVKFTPGIEDIFRKIKAHKGYKGLILFTAKGHEAANAIFDAWKIDGKPIRSQVDGVFTRNYLTRGGKAFKPSKDLRIIDSSLDHVIMIDDNPSRLFQPKNVRVFPKFNGDNYLTSKNETKNKKIIKYYESLLSVIYDEIKDSYDYAINNDVSFVEAFHPYSQAGAYCMRMIQDTMSYAKKEAVVFYRNNPKLCEEVFYGTKIKEK